MEGGRTGDEGGGCDADGLGDADAVGGADMMVLGSDFLGGSGLGLLELKRFKNHDLTQIYRMELQV